MLVEHLDKLIDFASLSDFKNKHACLILNKKNKIVSIGINRKNYRTNKIESIHAECSAILNINWYKIKIHDKLDLYVIRINKNNKLLDSYPCESCVDKIKKFSYIINNIYFSNSEGEIEKIKDLKKIYKTKLQRECY